MKNPYGKRLLNAWKIILRSSTVSFIFTALGIIFVVVKLRKSKWKAIKGIITTP